MAPTLVPVKSGERVKTDRRDALKLARNYRAGELTAVWVPDAAHEALRDLVRAREAAKKDQLRAKHRLSKFLLRHGRRPASGVKPWTLNYMAWVKKEVHFEQAAQEIVLSSTATKSREVAFSSNGPSALHGEMDAKCEQHLPHGVYLEATRNSKGWFVVAIFKIEFVHVDKQTYVIVFGSSAASIYTTRLNVSGLSGKQRRRADRPRAPASATDGRKH
jgi:hypothetical protein